MKGGIWSIAWDTSSVVFKASVADDWKVLLDACNSFVESFVGNGKKGKRLHNLNDEAASLSFVKHKNYIMKLNNN